MPLMGWKPDPPDARDRKFALLRPTLEKFPVGGPDYQIPRQRPVKRQNVEDCVPNTVAAAFEIRADRAGMALPDLSRRFLYYNGRTRDGGPLEDTGMTMRSGFAVCASLGAPAEIVWPYDRPINVRPSLLAYEAGQDRKLAAYHSIDEGGVDRADAIEIAVRADHPAAGGFLVGRPFVDYDGSGDVIWHAPHAPLGGHAMLIVGVRYRSSGRHFLLVSPWGENWGDHGTAWAAEDWITDTTSESFWVCTL